ncbi:acetyl-CoA carboxylase biotin carboxyl carrier protein [Shewanella xiamenensis]|jgi:acetyl-CoA carboxylase biotin carboxyl carrier protein|uniref:Biotin carboxyl carrier protein of acetyl-CoA carboxylase n=1 Tax=Shewanella xiamenensis TaxID=332186 RepID=A0AAW6QXF2_9GAMM|nr:MULTISPECIES: acetyl-CoA carboxylase biotin carboxyl carrier protein [Shewanella]PZP33998.1 MAG: acetyl-CoA carboxylase biotin carboxyl carrier protein [Shewanella oneidensis]MCD8549690.1 acetyl-CoA carboxylase biotin carboxyl carrier protein [Shewanella xiamenensis]MCD8558894.1 acetyl-CoA carboxylase biotin carboxyl carrier protein [Shewanella xiamenensis]MCT8864455.1 acetyl-CoA carboxylase biotin carboxyl carrier protein [Shewanella xiamenensis]MCT8876745.1 acetyl-CoA carboxylase biotin c
MAVDLRKIKKLIELVQESGIAELAITEGEESIRITRYGPHTVSTLEGAHNPPPSTASSPKLAKARDALPVIEGFVQVSPMVGTFHTSQGQTEAPLVRIGQRVARGDTLCIIEAMRMQNPIEAERDGIVGAIWVKDGDEVAFDQPLFTLIET